MAAPANGSVTHPPSLVCALTSENVTRTALASLNGLSVILTASVPEPPGATGAAGAAGDPAGVSVGAAGDFGASEPPPQARINATKTAGSA